MKLKLNEPMAKEFFSGFFGGLYSREIIENNLALMNKSKVQEMEVSCHFLDKNIMEWDENDVEIVMTCTLRRIDG